MSSWRKLLRHFALSDNELDIDFIKVYKYNNTYKKKEV